MAPITKTVLSLIVAACLATSTFAAPLQARQLHGEGVAADALLTDTDNGVGYGVENAENNVAANIASVKPAGTPNVKVRQADKIANGAAGILNAAGAPTAGNAVQQNGDSVDGQLTDGVANAGTSVGATEEQTLENAGKAVPRV